MEQSFKYYYNILLNPKSNSQQSFAIIMIQKNINTYNTEDKINFYLWLEANAKSLRQAHFARSKYNDLRM